MDLIGTLHRSLSERWRPEQVAKLLLEQRGEEFSPSERALLSKALPSHRWSSMADSFESAKDMAKQCATAAKLFDVKAPAQEPEKVRQFIDGLRSRLGATDGLDFKADRVPHKSRKRRKLPVSHRAYNKRFRMLIRLEKKYSSWLEVAELRNLARVAKSRLAFRITKIKDIESASFIAWITARLNVRSMFTFGKQERAFDEIAEMLLGRVPKGGDWLAISMVFPSEQTIGHLTDKKKGQLLGEWFSVMRSAAAILGKVAKRDKPNLESMIVARGNDSSSWNEAAGAYNKARDGWIATLYALGMEDALDSLAPGKALRLMAADVAWGHRTYGKGLDPDTQVWNSLPKPWDVVSGKRRCNRAKIESACEEAGTPHGGWVKPRNHKAVAFKATPELVHGVVCADPTLATLLKSAGYFGGHGHKAKTHVVVSRPFDGVTVSAAWPEDL